MAKLFKFDDKALGSILKGIKKLAKAASVTLGPMGRNVVIKGDGIISTKDGAKVASEIALEERFENMGASLIKEAASKTAETAGDGTTTSIVLAERIYSEGMRNVIAGANPPDVRKGIERASRKIVESLDRMARPVSGEKEILEVATISANNDGEVGSIIAEAIKRVGRDGVVTISEAKSTKMSLEVVEGMQFDEGYLSPYFITDGEKMVCKFENANILITDKKLSSAKEVANILETVDRGDPLLVIADDVDSEALATFVVNKVKASIPVVAVKAPGFGDNKKEILKDIAILTGATLISEDTGISSVRSDLLGRAKDVTISKERTIIIGGMGEREKIEKRVAGIKFEIENSKTSSEREGLEKRVAKLKGGVAVIGIGAHSEVEAAEKKKRAEDALNATKAACLEGIIPGGGVALIRASKELSSLKVEGDEKVGVEVVRRACFAPTEIIASNAGDEGAVVAHKVFEGDGNFGYNALSSKYGDLLKEGVIDPAAVTKRAFENASSISSILITTAAMIAEKEEDTPKVGGMPGMMPGMIPGGIPGMM